MESVQEILAPLTPKEEGRMSASAAAPVKVKTDAEKERTPSLAAGVWAAGLVGVAVLLALIVQSGAGFTPRVATVDALAGLAVGAFLVDRLLTFMPPLGASKDAKQRATDLALLRLGFGALFGAVFVCLTDLRAVHALAPDSALQLAAGTDRLIAVLAIAGGVAGLGSVVAALNPKEDTDGKVKTNTTETPEDADQPVKVAPAEGTIPAPAMWARIAGFFGVVVAALIAYSAVGDDAGIDLLGTDTAPDGTVALVVRFGAVLIAAAIVEQIVEQGSRLYQLETNDKVIVLGAVSVVLGVLAARMFDLYLLHNIGFFGATEGVPLNETLRASSSGELWADALLTGVVIAAGTKPLHDLGSRLRKTKEKAAVGAAPA